MRRKLGRGCRTDNKGVKLGEWHWKGQPERVIAPYLKVTQLGRDPEYRGTREILREAGGTTFQG